MVIARLLMMALCLACIMLLSTGSAALGDCGDSVIDAGEQCDDGNTQGGDCCSAACQFEAPGSPCTDNSICTWDEQCDGAGHCVVGSCDVCRPCGAGCGYDMQCQQPTTLDSCACQAAEGGCGCCALNPSILTLAWVEGAGTCGSLRSFRCSDDLSVACASDGDCVGTCDEVSGGQLPLDLACGAQYIGAGLNAVPLPVILPDTGASTMNVTACNGWNQELTLGASTEAETGSLRTCTSAGCLFGAPVPVPMPNPQQSMCVINEIAENVSGTATCDGDIGLALMLNQRVFYPGDLLDGSPLPDVPGVQPCPLCVRQCMGGAGHGTPCTDDTDCTAGASCSGSTRCLGGPSNGSTCTPDSSDLGDGFPTSHDCPPPSPHWLGPESTFEVTTGSLTKNAVDRDGGQRNFCGFCRDVAIEGSGCFEGDPDLGGASGCPDSSTTNCQPASGQTAECGTATPCTSDGDCTAPYESCVQADPGAFGNATATQITVTGLVAQSLTDGAPHPATLVGVSCVPPTFGGPDPIFNLPGPAVLTLEGVAQIENDFCGDNHVHAPTEECDGTDDAACPGLCQADCTCAPCDCCALNPTTFTSTSVDPTGVCGSLQNFRCQHPSNAAIKTHMCGSDADCDLGSCLPIVGWCEGDMGVTCSVDADCVGICEQLTSDNVNLDCGALYTGGGVVIGPEPEPEPGGNVSISKVTACNDGTLTLGPTTEAETGSARTCTSAGCFVGVPKPVVLAPPFAGLSTCVISRLTQDISGTATCTGQSNTTGKLGTDTFMTGDLLIDVPGTQPCPLCDRLCVGGDRVPCDDDSDCPMGSCDTETRCLGGLNDGDVCTPGPGLGAAFPTSHECLLAPPATGTTEATFETTTGEIIRDAVDEPQMRRVFCGFCRDVNVEGSNCFDGDPDPRQIKTCPNSAAQPTCQPENQHCSLTTSIACVNDQDCPATETCLITTTGCGQAVPCNDDSDCTAPYESCTQSNPGAFNRTTATRITMTGSTDGQCLAIGSGMITVVGVSCSTPTFNATIDGGAGLPGPNAVSTVLEAELAP